MDTLLTVAAAARLLDVSPRTLYAWLRSGKLPAVRLSRRCVRVRPEDLRAALKEADADRAARDARHAR